MEGSLMVHRIYEIYKKYILWLTAFIFVIALASIVISRFITTFEAKDYALTSSFVFLLLCIVERLISVSKISEEMLQKITEQQKVVYPFQESMEDLHEKIQLVKGKDKVIIEHLGLDMKDAWPELIRLITRCQAKEIECKILIMTDSIEELGPDAPEEVKQWCGFVTASIGSIKSDAKNLKELLDKSGKSFTLILKQYRGTPVTHGFKISKPLDLGYASFRRWKTSYDPDWKESYFRITKDTATDYQAKLNDIFSSTFKHYWTAESTRTIDIVN